MAERIPWYMAEDSLMVRAESRIRAGDLVALFVWSDDTNGQVWAKSDSEHPCAIAKNNAGAGDYVEVFQSISAYSAWFDLRDAGKKEDEYIREKETAHEARLNEIVSEALAASTGSYVDFLRAALLYIGRRTTNSYYEDIDYSDFRATLRMIGPGLHNGF